MSEQEFITSKIKEGFTKQQASLMAKMSLAKQKYAQQGGDLAYNTPKIKEKPQYYNYPTEYPVPPASQTDVNSHLKDIDYVQSGVNHTTMGEGYYIRNSDGQREFITKEAYKNTLEKSPKFKTYLNTTGGINRPVPGTEDKNYKPTDTLEKEKVNSKLYPIDFIQTGVNNSKLGKGYYLNYSNGTRDFIKEDAFDTNKYPNIKTYLNTTGGLNRHVKGTENKIYRPIMQMGGNYNPEEIPFIENPLYSENPNLNYGDYKKEEPLLGQVDQSVVDEQKRLSDQRNTNIVNNERVNIINPYGGINLEDSLNYGFQGLGEGNGYKAGLGLGLSALKGIRTGLSGYATGKENRRVAQEEYQTKQFETPRRYKYGQMGGKISNADILAQNAIVDQGQGSNTINLEGGEIVQTPRGEIQPVYGSRHVENGKIAEGVNVNLEEGSKILSDAKGLVMLSAKDVKELKERYNISVKKGDTPAQALKKFDTKIGLKKEQGVLADYAKKMENTLSIKDAKTKQVNLEFLQRSIAKSNEKIDALSELSKQVFDDIFDIQESKAKKGSPGQLFDSKGKVVTEKKEGVMQQGGDYMYNLATQYGISPERAEQLIMQMGGTSDEQELQQEIGIEQEILGALQQGAQPEEILQQLSQTMPPEEAQQIIEEVMANMQEESPQEQGGGDAMQIVEAYAQAVQQDTEAILQQLQQMQPEEQNQALQEMMSSMQEQSYAQQGGTRISSKFENPELYKKQNAVDKDWKTFGQLLKENPKEAMSEMKRLHPELYNQYFKDDKVPNYTEIKNFQEGYNSKLENIRKDYVKAYGADSEKVKSIDDSIIKDKFLPKKTEYDEAQDRIVNKEVRGIDSYLGNWTATRPNFSIDVLPKEDLAKVNKAGVNTASELKDKFPDLFDKYVKPKGLESDFWLGEVTAPNKTEETPTARTAEIKPKTEYKNTIRNVIPQLPVDLRLPPSSLQPLAKEYVPYGRLEPLKATPEAMLAEQERQRLTDTNRVQQSGLSAVQQEAILAQGLASSQMAAGDAIAKVQDYNNNNQYQTDVFNNQQRTKEAISNAQFNQDYINKTLGSMAASERDWRNYYTESNLQNRADYQSIENANLLNANSDKYAYIPGQGVEFIGGQSQDISIPNKYSKEEWQLMTQEQRNKAKQEQIDRAQMGGKKRAFFNY